MHAKLYPHQSDAILINLLDGVILWSKCLSVQPRTVGRGKGKGTFTVKGKGTGRGRVRVKGAGTGTGRGKAKGKKKGRGRGWGWGKETGGDRGKGTSIGTGRGKAKGRGRGRGRCKYRGRCKGTGRDGGKETGRNRHRGKGKGRGIGIVIQSVKLRTVWTVQRIERVNAEAGRSRSGGNQPDAAELGRGGEVNGAPPRSRSCRVDMGQDLNLGPSRGLRRALEGRNEQSRTRHCEQSSIKKKPRSKSGNHSHAKKRRIERGDAKKRAAIKSRRWILSHEPSSPCTCLCQFKVSSFLGRWVWAQRRVDDRAVPLADLLIKI